MTVLCADSSQARQEPLVATASRISQWLLVEHRGSWGPSSPPMDRLSRPAARHLGTVNARLLMIRRPQKLSLPGRWVFAIRSRPGFERILARHVLDDRELFDLDPPYGDDVPEGWSVRTEPLWIVCTHGRHDLCCAQRGRPVAKAMLAADPERVWEASHLGGDRFAANVVLLPEGHYFGRVEAAEVPALLAGDFPIDRWRGRSSLPLPTQAAQAFARKALSSRDFGDLALVSQREDGVDQWRVSLEGGVEVVVRYDRTGEPALLSCDAAQPQVFPRFVQVSISA
jgi:hypothetical protein